LTPSQRFVALVTGLRPPGWLELSGVSPSGTFSKAEFALAFAAAGRQCGDEPLVLTAEQAEQADADGLAWLVSPLRPAAAARVALLIAADALLDCAAIVELVENCFRRGDNAERVAVLRALAVLREPARYVDLGTQACRTHVQTVFEALACENPFAAAFLPDASFNQLVLKALFTGVELRRVIGLAARVTPELTRMAHDYANERRAAGRAVPADIDTLG